MGNYVAFVGTHPNHEPNGGYVDNYYLVWINGHIPDKSMNLVIHLRLHVPWSLWKNLPICRYPQYGRTGAIDFLSALWLCFWKARHKTW